MIRVVQVCALVLAFAACTTFDELGRGVCGNGLVEDGEDCDSSTASCARCAVVCTTDGQCPTTDYRCGVDGVCHAPGGALAAPIPAGPFQVSEVQVSDVDHDGIGDAVGTSRTSIVVRHGEPSGRLTRSESRVTPSQSAPAAFGDLDKDGSPDLVISTADGIVRYDSQFGALLPAPGQAAVLGETNEAVDARFFQFLDPLAMVVFSADETGQLFVYVIDFWDDANNAGALPCAGRLGLRPADVFVAANVDVYAVSGTELIFAFTTEATPSALCVLRVTKPFLGPASITEITPTTAVHPSRKVILADLDDDGDPCPGLVVSDGGPSSLRSWNGTAVAGKCTFSTAPAMGVALPAVPAPATSATIGRLPLAPAIFTVAPDTLVLSDGVYLLSAGIWTKVYDSPRRIGSVSFADLTGDGSIDGVLAAESEDDLDLLLRTQTLFPGYQLLRLDTASRVLSTTLGDFDGNGLTDIAFVEQLADYQRLMVSYGTPDRPLEPVQVAAFASISVLARVEFASSEDFLSIADDLVVIQPPLVVGGALQITILNGSAQRTMVSYSDPRPSGSEVVFRGAVVGRFAPSVGGASDLPDVVAFGVSPTDTRAWRMAGSERGLDATGAPGIPITGLGTCGATSPSLCIEDAAVLAWPVSETRDSVIAIDRAASPHAATFEATGTQLEVAPLDLTGSLPAGSVVRSMYAADLDGSGTPVLVAAFAPRTGTPGIGAVLVCSVDSGVPHGCEDLVPSILASPAAGERATEACVDAAPARIDRRDRFMTPSTRAALVVLCRDEGSSLYRVTRDASGSLAISVLARTSEAIGAIRIGDVTGDDVDDVLGIVGESGVQSLVVYPQCSSRELATCRGGS